ncbi:antifreeze protein Maxi [Drosophila virilis]|uniref:Uncharacterized protein n=1 Tax=Drosophila virilis TaxID=7244 RepID=B4LI27_DROVI|nr:regulatory protein zeste [Drosophila virilis]EDW68571.1 uncharacterized protein Dvir_GJ12787 [Drosophila virilis]
MYNKGLSCLICHLLIALFCSQQAEGRLHKRNGYYYRQLQPYPQAQHQHSSGGYFEPALTGHEEPEEQQHQQQQHHGSSKGHPSHGEGSKPGYSIGSGLRSIAQGSADQAYTAVANQHAAAKQAAFIAKNTLAQAASQAAATAQAALAGKQVILQELEQQAAEAQRALSRELEQLKAAKLSAKLAQQTAQAANNHISVLTAAVNNAKALAEQAEQTASEVSNQLASQATMVGQAKNRVEQVEEQLQQARVDFAATKESAIKAASSAAAAQVNASKAGAHATIGLHESANQQEHNHEEELESYDEQLDTSGVGHTASDTIEEHAHNG